MEWQWLSGWSRAVHARLPIKFRQAVRLLLLAASGSGSSSASTAKGFAGAVVAAAGSSGSSNSSSGAPSSSSSSSSQLCQLPDAVLERIIADAALPQGCWVDVQPPTLQQLEEALTARPGPAAGTAVGPPHFFHPMHWGMALQQLFMQGGGVAGAPAPFQQPQPPEAP